MPTTVSDVDRLATLTLPPRVFPRYRFTGSHHAIGRQFGEACGELIRRHRDLALSRLEHRAGIAPTLALTDALAFRPAVLAHAPFFDEEIRGIAEGAGLSLAEAYLLQLRAELVVVRPPDPASGGDGESGDECTTFAVLPEATANGVGLVGQHADLPAFYGELGVVIELVPDDQPAILMLTPAGQVSYIGINDRGLGCFANFLTCDGWRVGFPRYLLSRLALTHETVDEAIAAVQGVKRASSRNLIMLDVQGTAADLETTPTRDARIEPTGGIVAHSNHYVSNDLADEERSPAKHVANSRARLERMEELLRARRGELTADTMVEVLRDRTGAPDALCRIASDDPESDVITFASVIAEPAAGRFRVAVGPPHEHEYVEHAFSG